LNEFALKSNYGIGKLIMAPCSGDGIDATPAIAAAAGGYISQVIAPNMTIGVGWGRTLHMALPHITGRTLNNLRVVSLLGGIMDAGLP
jgi:DNA-binding transcriptional regulator LsrR (DeoR family)